MRKVFLFSALLCSLLYTHPLHARELRPHFDVEMVKELQARMRHIPINIHYYIIKAGPAPKGRTSCLKIVIWNFAAQLVYKRERFQKKYLAQGVCALFLNRDTWPTIIKNLRRMNIRYKDRILYEFWPPGTVQNDPKKGLLWELWHGPKIQMWLVRKKGLAKN